MQNPLYFPLNVDGIPFHLNRSKACLPDFPSKQANNVDVNNTVVKFTGVQLASSEFHPFIIQQYFHSHVSLYLEFSISISDPLICYQLCLHLETNKIEGFIEKITQTGFIFEQIWRLLFHVV